MVTVKRIGKHRLSIYADDHHPPHVHVAGPNGSVCIDIEDGVVVRGKLTGPVLGEALRWIEEHREELQVQWRNLNDTDPQ